MTVIGTSRVMDAVVEARGVFFYLSCLNSRWFYEWVGWLDEDTYKF